MKKKSFAKSLRQVGPWRATVRVVLGALTAREKREYALGLRSPAELCLPDFLGIGAQKAGSSWLHRNLRCHPELYLPRQKELHYFDRGFHSPLSYYSNRFKPGADLVKGEVTPGYSVLPVEQIRFIRTLMPELRTVLIMRNPVERAWSHALMRLVSRGGRKVDEIPEEEFFATFRMPAALARGNYPAVLRNWRGVFPPESVHVCFYEDIIEQPEELLRGVFRHLGVSEEVDWSRFPLRETVNKGPGKPIPPKYREDLERLYAPVIEELYQEFGEKVAPWRCVRADNRDGAVTGYTCEFST